MTALCGACNALPRSPIGCPDGLCESCRGTENGYPHDYGQHCCCADCTGPDGTDCTPDLYGDCARCNRKAEHDDPDGAYIAAILERIDHQAEGQTSWITF